MTNDVKASPLWGEGMHSARLLGCFTFVQHERGARQRGSEGNPHLTRLRRATRPLKKGAGLNYIAPKTVPRT